MKIFVEVSDDEYITGSHQIEFCGTIVHTAGIVPTLPAPPPVPPAPPVEEPPPDVVPPVPVEAPPVVPSGTTVVADTYVTGFGGITIEDEEMFVDIVVPSVKPIYSVPPGKVLPAGTSG